ncbi:Neurexin-4 [Portunus trituberculatus]|uniref:Neurexin-4 n=1 Tax=Portunus trituberculatus TaxID=210409 RepID=A0A5B7G4Z9_PORTR|nr:Neurexin-4 [Portunus trituberculatus]
MGGCASSVFEDYCGIEPIRYPEEEAETRRPPVVSEEVLMGLYSDNSAVLGVAALPLRSSWYHFPRIAVHGVPDRPLHGAAQGRLPHPGGGRR